MCRFFLPFVLVLAIVSGDTVTGSPVDDAQKLVQQGLSKDTYDLLRPWLLDPKNGDHDQFSEGLGIAVQSLQHINRESELDELLESVTEVQKNSWLAIIHIAEQYDGLPGYGIVIDNKFQRGNNHDGKSGQWTQVHEKDHLRALQLLNDAMPLALQETVDGEKETADGRRQTADFFFALASAVMPNVYQAWKLQVLTDLTVPPDYDTPEQYYGGGSTGAPVDAEGNPIFYHFPESWETAKNDGERWRWALEQAVKCDPDQQKHVWRSQARFYQSQFGEQTLQGFNFYRSAEQETDKTASILTLETLSDDETIAKLATGIKRFTLPDEFNYIKLYQKIGDADALTALAYIAKNRRQYPKATEYYKAAIEKTEDGEILYRLRQQSNQITGNWGRFEHAGSNVAGLKADLRYVFRNGKKVKLTVREINVEKLIGELKTYIKSKPVELDWRRIQIDQIGQELLSGRIDNTFTQYVGEVIKTWEMNLNPADKHFDRSATVSFENKTAGAFLIRAEMEGGNAETAVVWLEETAIVRKPMDKALLYFVADAETGKPINNATVDLFGYTAEHRNTPAPNNRPRQEPELTWTFVEKSMKTDANGCTQFPFAEQDSRFNSLITVTEPKKKGVAHLGFENLWIPDRYDQEYNEVKTFVLTDRPVYRPKDTVKIKAWVGTAKYDMPNTSEWAGKAIHYTITDPKGEKIAEKDIVLDEYGGLTAELELPKDATLGGYGINFMDIRSGQNNWLGQGNFRVEEYKKPEYEVTIDAPKEPVSLGDKVTATINAKYYFGSPVSEATVKYTVLR
ncbi:MAG: hypothetical protein LBI05_00525, partial [Planctomycetaceae bacterium]|nr:hypothetical protein [Planctomycetaceae bacterium]